MDGGLFLQTLVEGIGCVGGRKPTGGGSGVHNSGERTFLRRPNGLVR